MSLVIDSFTFISHASRDDKHADRVHRYLTRRGITTWMDHRNILPSDNWHDTIEKALCQSRNTLLVLTENTMSCADCKNEWITTLQLNKRLFIAVIGEPPIPWTLKVYQYVDLNREWELGLRTLAESILKDRPILEIANDGQIARGEAGTLTPIHHTIRRALRLILLMDEQTFRAEATRFIHFLARLLGVAEAEIGLENIQSGSTIVTISIPQEYAFALMDLAEAHPELLVGYPLQRVELLSIKPLSLDQAERVVVVRSSLKPFSSDNYSSQFSDQLLKAASESFMSFVRAIAKIADRYRGQASAATIWELYCGVKGGSVTRSALENAVRHAMSGRPNDSGEGGM